MWEPYDPLSYFAHVVVGFAAYAAGLAALLSAKGSVRHIRAGRVYAVAIAIPVVTAFIFLRQTFFPLVVVLAVATAYLVASAVLAIRNTARYAKPVHSVLLLIPVALTLFGFRQFVASVSWQPGPWLGPLVIAATFGTLAVGDVRMALHWRTERDVWLRRHLDRMVLSFGFATMAVFRLGIDTGLSLEFTVVVPLCLALLGVAYFRRRFPIVIRSDAQPKPAA